MLFHLLYYKGQLFSSKNLQPIISMPLLAYQTVLKL